MSGKKGAIVKELTPEQFWSVGSRDPDTGCLLWTRHLNRPGGYGRVMQSGRLILVHRHAYQLANGPIPDDLRVLHACDRPSCFEPSHLWLGTQLDNIADRVRKGRNKRGPQRKQVAA